MRDHLDLVDKALDEWSRANPSAFALVKPEDNEGYARWAPEVGRYSFHWNLE